MTDIYGFRQKAVAEQLKALALKRLQKGTKPHHAIGEELRLVKLDEILPAKVGDEVGPAVKGTVMYTGAEGGTMEEEDNTIDVYNTTRTSFAKDEEVQCIRWREVWVVLDKGSGNTDMIQFNLRSGWGPTQLEKTGTSTALVLSATGADEVGSLVEVTDPQRLFENAVGYDEVNAVGGTGSIGWAVKAKGVWKVISCTQMINRYKCQLENGSCSGNWDEDITLTVLEPCSVWPYVDADPQIETGDTITARNLHGLSGNGGFAWIERTQGNPVEPVIDESPTVPYTVPTGPSAWSIVDVQYAIATYITVRWNGSAWEPSIVGSAQTINCYDGLQPDSEYSITISVPEELKMLGENSGGICLATNTKGLSAIDRTGCGASSLHYVVVSTSSSLNGEVHEAAIAGTLSPEAEAGDDEIIIVDGCEVKYKKIKKTFLFGSPSATGACEMAESEETNAFQNWNEIDVVESVAYDPETCSLTMQKSTIKSCFESPKPPESVTLGCPDNYDWHYIFDNYIYHQDWYHVDYYDITWPEGCTPCPDGCCDQLLLDESHNYVEGLTPAECAATVNPNPVSGSDVVSATMIAECPSDPTGCCQLADDDYRADKTQLECVSGLGGFWMGEGSTCPEVGCCTMQITAGGEFNEQMTSAQCGLYESTGSYEGTPISSATWAAGSCTQPSPCELTEITNFIMSGLENVQGGCVVSFEQTEPATITNGSATVQGYWTSYDGMSDVGGPGTITMSTDGTNWNWSGVAVGIGITVTNASPLAMGGCIGGGSGGAQSSGGASFPCEGTWANATYSFNSN